MKNVISNLDHDSNLRLIDYNTWPSFKYLSMIGNETFKQFNNSSSLHNSFNVLYFCIIYMILYRAIKKTGKWIAPNPHYVSLRSQFL